VSQYQKGETNLDLLEQEVVSGSGISWAVCKSVPGPPLRALMLLVGWQEGHPTCKQAVRDKK